MGRPRINHEAALARFPAGTFKRLNSILHRGERRTTFIRIAVEHEIERRRKTSFKPSMLNQNDEEVSYRVINKLKGRSAEARS